MIKKRIILILVIILSIIVSSCTNNTGIKEPEQTNEELNLFIRGIDGKSVGNFEYAIEKYKKLYPEIKINLDYSDKNENVEAQKELATRIMAGNSPDVLYVNGVFTMQTDIYKLMNNNYFTDLNPYLEEDKDFKMDEYNVGIIKGGAIEGKQFLFPLYYSSPVILYDKLFLKEKNININNKNFEELFEEFLLVYENNKDIQLVNEMNHPFNKYPFDVYSSYSGIKNFDYKNKKIDFNEKSNKNIAVITKTIFSNFSKNSIESLDFLIKMKNKSLFSISLLNTVGTQSIFPQSSVIKSFSEPEFKFIKNINNEMLGLIKVAVGIYNGSKNKQNAYNFIKILMDDTAQYSFKLNASESMMNTPIKNTKIIDYYKACVNNGNYQLAKKPLDQEYFDRFYEETQKITNAVFTTPWDYKYYELMLPYFKGEKSYEECFELVKAQAKIYINE